MNRKLLSKYISNAAKHLIKDSNYTYRDVSNKLNVSYGFFRQLMSNNRTLTITDIYQLAKLGNVSVNYFFPPIHGTKQDFIKYKSITGDKSYQNFLIFLKDLNNK